MTSIMRDAPSLADAGTLRALSSGDRTPPRRGARSPQRGRRGRRLRPLRPLCGEIKRVSKTAISASRWPGCSEYWQLHHAHRSLSSPCSDRFRVAGDERMARTRLRQEQRRHEEWVVGELDHPNLTTRARPTYRQTTLFQALPIRRFHSVIAVVIFLCSRTTVEEARPRTGLNLNELLLPHE